MSEPLKLERANSMANRLQEYLKSEFVFVTDSYRNSSRYAILTFIKYIGSGAMSPENINGYAEHLRRSGISSSTIGKNLTMLKKFFIWCWKMGHSSVRWYEYLPTVKGQACAIPEIIQHHEYLQIRKFCYDKDRDWLVVLGYHTGLRLGDCCCLRWSNIDQENQVIKVTPRKTARKTAISVSIPYSTGSDLHKLIVEKWETRDQGSDVGTDYVCPDMAIYYLGTPTNQVVPAMFNVIFKRAGIIGRTFKHFRSTFESRMANSGMNIGLAAKITGRSDTKTLLRYIRPDMDAAREGIARAMDLHNVHKGFA